MNFNFYSHLFKYEKESISGDYMTKFEVYKDKAGEYRFRLKAGNGQVIAISEGYKSRTSCMNGIESVKKNAPTAAIVEIEK